MRATEAMGSVLGPLTALDWGVPAGDVQWTCRDTAAHVVDDLFSYASQVIAEPPSSYLPVEAVVDPVASNDDLLKVVSMSGRLLAQTVDAAGPSARSWHPYGVSDPDGFAAMGIVEVLVHTYDICRGLGVAWSPPAELCVPVLRRLFPQAPPGEPATVLLYCCGRTALQDLPRLEPWRWDSTVPGDPTPRA